MTLKYTYKTLVKWNDTILKFLAHIRKIFNFEKKNFENFFLKIVFFENFLSSCFFKNRQKHKKWSKIERWCFVRLKYTYKTLVKRKDTLLKFWAHIRKNFNFEKKNFENVFFEIVITPSFYVQKWLFTTKIDKNSKMKKNWALMFCEA